ncbi:TIGR03960 family B12-binding radical SAM protein [Candidatus Sumerlaeota bacterium]|nr:TIGR03960 family B12-binding radical SAM protein [Candidatus Sumerlaeota bacterium]
MNAKAASWYEYIKVERPGRYIAREWNAIAKDAESCLVRMVLAFPDVYEIGMSYHGFRILYERINAREGYAAERAFAPWLDAEKLLRETGSPLCSLETGAPLYQFDIIGFTLQHELLYSNILTMLEVGGAPIKSSDRTEAFPLVIGGGEGALAPEPVADFFDAFVIGDGEDVALEIMDMVADFKKNGKGTRNDLLWKLKDIPGVYAPSFYIPEYASDQTLSAMKVTKKGVPPSIEARRFNIALDKGPVRPIAPNLRIIQERLAIEACRGCANGCRFCQAGMINRPIRERPVEQILEIAECGIKNTGFEEISLLALSTADYSRLSPLMRALREKFDSRGVSVSLPSIRINSCDLEMIDSAQSVRQSGLTLAPEAGTERLRRIINKPVNDATLLDIIRKAFSSGRKTLKLYFMIGLPTETIEDIDGMIRLIKQVENAAREAKRGIYTINVTLSPFVPKAHTPFQWESQCSPAILKERIEHIKSGIKSRRITIKAHNINQSNLEAVFARGDRKLARALLRAWELGCRFDSWNETFRPDLWQRAFQETGIDPSFYATRERRENELFPWDHIHPGVNKSFLYREWKKGFAGEITPNCVHEGCQGCGACEGGQGNILSPSYEKKASESSPLLQKPRIPAIPLQRLRITYAKKGAICLISHLDLGKTIHAILKRAGVPMAFTQGFNPLPRAQYGPPLPLGYEGAGELIDLFLSRISDPEDILVRMGEQAPQGLEFLKIEEIPLKHPSLGSAATAADYEAVLPRPLQCQSLSSLQSFIQSSAWQVRIPRKSGWIERDLKKSVVNLTHLQEKEQASRFCIRIRLDDKNYIDPRSALVSILALDASARQEMRVMRTNILLKV